MTETYLTVFDGCDFSGSKYSNEDRMNAVANYLAHGTFTKASKATGVPASTIRGWTKTEWWDALTAQLRSETDDRMRAEYTQIIHEGNRVALEGLASGEVKPKDAVVMSAISFDKRQLLDSKPTSITQKDSNANIQAKLEQVSRDLRKLEGMDAVLVTDPKKEE